MFHIVMMTQCLFYATKQEDVFCDFMLINLNHKFHKNEANYGVYEGGGSDAGPLFVLPPQRTDNEAAG